MENAIKQYRIKSTSNFLGDVFKEAPGIARQYILGQDSFTGLLRESKVNDRTILEGYFNDIYKLFVRRLSSFECATLVNEEDTARLKSLLDEMIKIKGMLCEGLPGQPTIKN